MQRYSHVAAAALVAILLLIAHRAAYKGYFSDDDLDNLVQTRTISAEVFARELVTPLFAVSNFRPSGHLFYRLMGDAAGLRFGPYIAVLHLLHGLNIVLVWLVLRRMGAPPAGRWAGALLFAFHMAVFDALWKPMYIFDVLCGTFTLLTLLLYLKGHWLWALIPFWFGYKSKELIVALPPALLAWEYLAGERRWKRVLPFALIAASFTIQGILNSSRTDNDYTLRFTAAALGKTLPYYGSAMLLVPWLGLALPLLLVVKDARVRWGVLFLFMVPAPLWFLPGRLFSVYLYVPLIGLAVAFAFLAARWKLVWVALFFLLWIPGNHLLLRKKRGETLDAAAENRLYVTAAGEFLKARGPFEAVIYDGGPSRMNTWGREAAIRWFDPRPELLICNSGSREVAACFEKSRLAVIGWDQRARRLLPAVRGSGETNESFVDVSKEAPLWVFGDGWHSLEGGYRWTSAEAVARLQRPEGASLFRVRVNASPIQLQDQGEIGIELIIDGKPLGVRKYTKPAWSDQDWPLEPGPAGPVTVTLKAERPYRPSNGDPRVLGAAVVAFGFVK